MADLLNRLKDALSTLDDDVYYGIADRGPKDPRPWDCIVFGRDNAPINRNCTSLTHAYWVDVLREGYVPEGTEQALIDAVCAIPGMKLDADQGIEYDYLINPKSGEVVEAVRLHFKRAVKL